MFITSSGEDDRGVVATCTCNIFLRNCDAHYQQHVAKMGTCMQLFGSVLVLKHHGVVAFFTCNLSSPSSCLNAQLCQTNCGNHSFPSSMFVGGYYGGVVATSG